MRHTITLSVLVLAMLAGSGCGETEAPPGPASPPGPGVEDRAEVVGRGFLIEVIEEHTDDLPEALADYHDALEAPFVVDEGRIVIQALPRAQDADGEEEVAVAPPEADGRWEEPLATCRLFVVQHMRYEGRGRADEDRRFFAFQAPQATLALEGWAEAGDRYVHDPAVAGSPFEIALRSIRLLGVGGGHLEITVGVAGLQTTLGGSTTSLQAGERAVLHEEGRTLTVEEKPLTREAVDPGEFSPYVLPAVLRPGRTLGPVQFRSRLTVVFHGELPVERASSDEEGGER